MKEHSIVIETCITTEDITNFLAMEGNGFDYWAEICSDDADYEAARQRLMDGEKKPACEFCYEDILAEILENGDKLTIYDREEDKDHELTLEKLLEGFAYYMKLTASDGRTGVDDMDAEVADQILQIAIFGEVIYG